MNYQLHYDRLMQRGRERSLPREIYVERHHIVPRCMGGTDESANLVELTAEEHYIAHQLLVKIYPDNALLWCAVAMMTASAKTTIRNNKMYGWIRQGLSKATSKLRKEWYKNNPHPKGMLGKRHSDEARAKISENSNTGVAVYQYTLENVFVEQYNTIVDAAKSLNIATQTLWVALHNPNRTAGGFRFSYHKTELFDASLTPKSNRKSFTRSDSDRKHRGLHCPPWEIIECRGKHLDLLIYWQKANILYYFWLRNSGLTASDYAKHIELENLYMVRKIIKKFCGGWIPIEDTAWIDWMKRYDLKS